MQSDSCGSSTCDTSSLRYIQTFPSSTKSSSAMAIAEWIMLWSLLVIKQQSFLYNQDEYTQAIFQWHCAFTIIRVYNFSCYNVLYCPGTSNTTTGRGPNVDQTEGGECLMSTTWCSNDTVWAALCFVHTRWCNYIGNKCSCALCDSPSPCYETCLASESKF